MKLPLEKEYLKKDLEHSLLGKDSYGFWSRYNCGFNLVKLGKTGTNVMDVQICYVKFSEE
jgi:glycerate-2-kinase